MSDNISDGAVLGQGHFVRLIRQGHWEYADRIQARAAVMIIPVTDEGRLVLIEQHRVPLAAKVLELPAGLVGDIAGEEDEALITAAHRELLEETGYVAQRMELLMSGPPSAGMCSEIITFFLASGLTRVGPGGGDHLEDIVVHEVPLTEVVDWLSSRASEGMLVDPKIYAGLYFVERMRSR
jgi:ADP-ribose pyrophosphatase